jgi:ribosomal protein S18 acetylase RimI-like enzyme
MITVRSAGRADLPRVARVLGQAFADDPVIAWMQPDVRRRKLLFRALARYEHYASDSSDLAEDGGTVVGASLWDPPEFRQSTWWAVRSLPLLARALGSRLNYGSALQRMFHERRPPSPHWYLAELGAAPPGRGTGSALLEHRLQKIETSAYLESTNERNVPLYERFGFRVIDEIHLPYDGPTCWQMLRD